MRVHIPWMVQATRIGRLRPSPESAPWPSLQRDGALRAIWHLLVVAVVNLASVETQADAHVRGTQGSRCRRWVRLPIGIGVHLSYVCEYGCNGWRCSLVHVPAECCLSLGHAVSPRLRQGISSRFATLPTAPCRGSQRLGASVRCVDNAKAVRHSVCCGYKLLCK